MVFILIVNCIFSAKDRVQGLHSEASKRRTRIDQKHDIDGTRIRFSNAPDDQWNHVASVRTVNPAVDWECCKRESARTQVFAPTQSANLNMKYKCIKSLKITSSSSLSSISVSKTSNSEYGMANFTNSSDGELWKWMKLVEKYQKNRLLRQDRAFSVVE